MIKRLNAAAVLALLIGTTLFTGPTEAQAGPSGKNNGAGARPRSRVMTFNIRFDFESDAAQNNRWEQRADVVAKTILASGAAIVGLQEDKGHQIEDLQRRMGGWEFHGKGRDGAGSERCSIAWQREHVKAKETGEFWLSDTPDVVGSSTWGDRYPRKCTWAVLELKSKKTPLLVLNTHLPEGEGQNVGFRNKGVKVMRDFIERRIGDKNKMGVIVLGDFNAGEETETRQLLAGGKEVPLRDAWDEAKPNDPNPGTFGGFRGMRTQQRIDWILLGGPVRANGAAKIDEQIDGRWPSDHYPVLADLDLK